MDLQEVALDPAESRQRSKDDFNFLAMLCMPETFAFPFPPFFVVLFSLLTAFKSAVERFVIGIPRGFAKTTFVKILCVWYILFSHKQFILIVGASEDLAVNTLEDISDMMDGLNIVRLFGNWRHNMEVDRQSMKIFNFNGRNIILRAIGAQTKVRGIVRKNRRPDVILMDDVQTKEDSENPVLADQLLKWIIGTLAKTKSPSGCTYIYVGNMYPTNCILDKLRKSPQWTSMVTGGILADGTSLWEELKPVDELLQEYQSDSDLGHPEIFMSEVMNLTDMPLAHGIDVEKIPHPPQYLLEAAPDAKYILIDPSSGRKAGDDCTIFYVRMADNKPIYDTLMWGVFTPKETIKNAVNLALATNTRAICVESTSYQITLLFWFGEYLTENGLENAGFELLPLPPKNQAKNDRIKRGMNRLVKGEIYVVDQVRAYVMDQIRAWDPTKIKNKDDIIDLIGYSEYVEQNYQEQIVCKIIENEEDTVEASHSNGLALPF